LVIYILSARPLTFRHAKILIIVGFSQMKRVELQLKRAGCRVIESKSLILIGQILKSPSLCEIIVIYKVISSN
jgi:hypothetical protein